jgi:hypothetical protein
MVGTPRHVGLGIRSQQTTQKEHCQQRQKMSFHNLSIQIGCKGTNKRAQCKIKLVFIFVLSSEST